MPTHNMNPHRCMLSACLKLSYFFYKYTVKLLQLVIHDSVPALIKLIKLRSFDAPMLYFHKIVRYDRVFRPMDNRCRYPHRVKVFSAVFIPEGICRLNRGDAGRGQRDELEPVLYRLALAACKELLMAEIPRQLRTVCLVQAYELVYIFFRQSIR